MSKKIATVLIMGVAVLALSSCSVFNSKSAAGSNGMGGTTAAEGATTSGVAGQAQFGSAASMAAANKLKAPHDQVYHFAFNKDTVHQDDVASINAQATYLVGHPSARIRLDGDTDSRGSREYNVALGWRRAKAVASLFKQQGVAPDQLIVNSFGEEKPVAFCHNESCYKENRRVTLTYEAK